MKINQHFHSCLFPGLVAFSILCGGQIIASESPESGAEKERVLIAILKSSAPPEEKAVPCKQLAVYGSKAAVPALAALLPDPDLSSWARIALEAIPDPAADEALRKALNKVQGRLLVGVINSIGVRRDQKAVGPLIQQMKASDEQVVSAAAVALGHIGGSKAAKALANALPNSPASVRSAIAEGSVLCGEHFLNQGKYSQAIAAYDAVRSTEVSKAKLAEATRGAILARRTSGLGLLLEQLRSNDKDMLAIGLSTARELPGREVSEALAAELRRAGADRQPALLLALADRRDPAVLPAILEAARHGTTRLRLTAIGVMDQLGRIESVPVLLEVATGAENELSQPATAALARLPGTEVDAELLRRLRSSSGKMRQTLITVAGQRRIESALPEIIRSCGDSDSDVRCAAAQAIGAIGGDPQVADLVRLLPKTQTSKERAEVETALITLSGRSGANCVPYLLPLMKSDQSESRMIGLHALASAGGTQALGAVRSATEDNDENVQDEAVRTLSTWPNNWPDDAAIAEPLLVLARSGKKESHQVLALRGYLEYVKADKKLKEDERATRIQELLPLLKRPEEKRQAIAVIDDIPSAAALEMLTTFASEPAIAEDACSAIVSLAGKNAAGVPKPQRQKALELVAENSKNDGTKRKAGELLKKIQ